MKMMTAEEKRKYYSAIYEESQSKSQSSQVEFYRAQPFFALVEIVLTQIESYAFYESDMPEVQNIAMIIAEIFKLPPAADVRIAGNNIPASMVAEIFLQIRNDNVQRVIENYHEATYHIKHTKTYLRTALYNSVFEAELRVNNAIRADMPELFFGDRG